MNHSELPSPESAAPPVELREATVADDAFLRDLYAGVRARELAAAPWTDAEKRRFCEQQFALQDRHYRDHFPGARCLVVRAGARAIGRVYRARSEGTLYVLDIALVPEMRGRGVGTALMRGLVAEADRDGLAMVLHVEPDNPVKRLYLRLGFVEGAAGAVYVEMTRAPVAAAFRTCD